MPLRPPLQTIPPKDPRYGDLVGRGINLRFRGEPEAIVVPGEPDQVVDAVTHAHEQHRGLAVRSGGHCFEALVDRPDVTTLIDLSSLRRVGFDPRREAFVAEAGATLGDLYRTLYLGWGVTVPAGRCPDVGVGGHIAGGGGGALSRRLGLSVDYLEAVEVVVVDQDGTARSVVASRDPADPAHDLWWAHTGGGGGAFGVVTRYWFRAGDTGSPQELLPAPPAAVHKASAQWAWADLSPKSFGRLVRNFCLWHEHNSAPGSPAASLDNSLTLTRPAAGYLGLETMVDAGDAEALATQEAFLAAVREGVGAEPRTDRSTTPWLTATLVPDEFAGVSGRFKSKAAFLRKAWDDEQIAVVHRYLTDETYANPATALYLISHGGQINAVAPDATATAHRDGVLKAYWSNFWFDPREDDTHLAWIRGFYRDVFADADGVPDPARGYGGAFINYADADLADPGLSGSRRPWTALYFRDNYARLQHAKRQWDPLDVFHHPLSVRLPG